MLDSCAHLQNCTDHVVMLFTHPDRRHKLPRPRTGRSDRRDPARTGGVSGGGLGVSSMSGSGGGGGVSGQGYFHVGGNAFGSGGGVGAGLVGSHYHGGHVAGDPSKGGTYDAVGHGAGDGDITLVDPGKVSWSIAGKAKLFDELSQALPNHKTNGQTGRE